MRAAWWSRPEKCAQERDKPSRCRRLQRSLVYAKQEGLPPCGGLDLRGGGGGAAEGRAAGGKASVRDVPEGQHVGRPFAFEVAGASGERFLLSAESEKERRAWVAAIAKAIALP